MEKIKQNTIAFLTFLVLFFIGINVSAHNGGHYHTRDMLNTWTLANGEIVKGNFSMSKGTDIVLEQLGGRLVVIPITSLSLQDQKLARFKIKKMRELNEVLQPTSISNNEPDFFKGPLSTSFTIIFCLLILFYVFNNHLTILKSVLSKQTSKRLALFSLSGLLFIFACNKSTTTSSVPTNPTTGTTIIPKTSTGFIDSAYTPYKNTVTTSWDATYFYIASNGIPSHNMMVGITNWQQQVPIPQLYTGSNKWSIPLQPEYANTPLSTKSNLMKGAVALAVNGIPIFNALNNRGEDSYLIGELDQWGGHCGKGDDYHYHAAPLHLSNTSGLKPIAFALDGFAVYGTTEADGTTMTALDTCHGHSIGTGVYHYHGTTTYPYVVGAMKGKVTIDPSTPSPESQILPQAFSSPLRPATSPLNGASITAFTSPSANAYSLTYKRGIKNGYINYSWDANNKFTFIFIDTAGFTTTATYQR